MRYVLDPIQQIGVKGPVGRPPSCVIEIVGGIMRLIAASLFGLAFATSAASAASITVGGFVFDAGEAAFADDAFLVSGSGVRFNCTAGGTAASSFAEALSGSGVTQCANVSGGGDGIVEVRFTDNSIVNGAGTDLVIFEVSGPQSPGTPDPRERFEVSILDGSTYSPFVAFDPVATGFGTPEPTLDIFAVQIDLSSFGIATGVSIDRVRLHLFDNGLGSKGADIAALGALNSGAPVPEPSTALLLGVGLAVLAACRRGFRVCTLFSDTCGASMGSTTIRRAPPVEHGWEARTLVSKYTLRMAVRSNLGAVALHGLAAACGVSSLLLATPSFGLTLYFTQDGSTQNRVNRIDSAGGAVEVLQAGLAGPNGVDVDTSSGKVYWSDVSTNSIARKNLDGTGAVETVLTAGLDNPFDLALDTQRDSLFFVNRGVGLIQKSSLDGQNVVDVVTAGGAVYLQLDIAAQELYFNFGGSGPTLVGRAGFDGTGFETIVSEQSVISGIALDLAAGQLYYGMRETNMIRRADLNGNGAQDFLTGLPEHPLDLAVDPVSGKLYWSFAEGIHRVNLDGSGPIETVVSGLQGSSAVSGVSALALDLPPVPVPEPHTAILVVWGLLALATYSRNAG